jgi:hypothetical protein
MDAPFRYPAPKAFKPAVTMASFKEYVRGTNQNFDKKTYCDVHEEKNLSEVRYLLHSTDGKGTTGNY